MSNSLPSCCKPAQSPWQTPGASLPRHPFPPTPLGTPHSPPAQLLTTTRSQPAECVQVQGRQAGLRGGGLRVIVQERRRGQVGAAGGGTRIESGVVRVKEGECGCPLHKCVPLSQGMRLGSRRIGNAPTPCARALTTAAHGSATGAGTRCQATCTR